MQTLIFWRRVKQTIKNIQDNNKDSLDNNTSIRISEQGYKDTYMVNCGILPNPQGRGKALLVSDRETCPREGLDTYAGVAICAGT